MNTRRKIIRAELLKDCRDTFYSIYNEYEYENRCLPHSGYGYDYENAYRERRVRISRGEDAKEWIFKCLARDQQSGKIEEYSVSRPYNVNLVGIFAYPIAARFIFTYDQNEKVLTMVAMAEEAAIEWEFARVTKIVTLFYMLVRWKEKVGE